MFSEVAGISVFQMLLWLARLDSGLGSRRPKTVSPEAARVCTNADLSGAGPGASRCETQPDMPQLSEALSSLPEVIQSSMLAIIKKPSKSRR
jgi:hypothetical protein